MVAAKHKGKRAVRPQLIHPPREKRARSYDLRKVFQLLVADPLQFRGFDQNIAFIHYFVTERAKPLTDAGNPDCRRTHVDTAATRAQVHGYAEDVDLLGIHLRNELKRSGREVCKYPHKRWTEFLPVNNEIDKALLLQKFRPLKPRREVFSDGLLDDARSCEADQRLLLRDVDVSEHRKTRCNASGRRVRHDGNIRHLRLR